MTTANVSLTPLNELYKVAYLAEGGDGVFLHCALMNEADMAAETDNLSRTGKLRGPGQKIALSNGQSTAFVTGLVEAEGKVAKTMFGASNLGKQVIKYGGLAALCKARFGYTGVVNATASAKSEAPLDIEAELKAIRDREEQLMALLTAKKEAAEASLNALAESVSEFFDIEVSDLKTILTESGATDLASGMRAAKAYLA